MDLRLLAIALSATVALAGFGLPAVAATASAPPNATVAPRPLPSPARVTPNPEDLPPPPGPPVLPAVPNIAPGYVAPPEATLPNSDLVGVEQQPFVGIRLDDAVTMALQRNTDLAISASNERIANYQVVAAKGAYDIAFMLEPQYQHSVQAALSPFQAGPGGGPITQISSGASAAFNGQTPFGTRYSISGSAQAIRNDSAFDSYDPFYQTAISLNLTQPLLRGAGAGDPARRQLILATENAQIQASTLLTQASQTITNVADTYWDLVAAWRNVGIQEEGLRNAEAQAQSNARLARRGAAAPVDVVESYTQINVFQDNVFAALQQVQALQDQLKSLILANPADPLWTANLVPTSAVLQLPKEPRLDELIVTALENRPEVAQLRAQRLEATENLAYAKNQLLPQVDLGVGAAVNGFAGVPTNLTGTPFFQTLVGEIDAINYLNGQLPLALQLPTIVPNFGTSPSYQAGTLGRSWSNLFDFRYPSYTISLTLKLPLRNRTAKAEYAIANEQSKQVAIEEILLLQRIRSEAANAIQTLRETQYRLAAATAARVAAARVLLAEQRRFIAGTSTTFLVLQRQLDLANTEARQLQAQTDLNKAVAQLDQVAGTDFASYGIDVKTLGAKTLDLVSPTKDVLPLPPGSQALPPPVRR